MTPLHKLNVRQSERRQRINALGDLELPDDKQTAELKELRATYDAGEVQLQALETVASAEDAAADPGPAAEDADRLELRSRCRVGSFLKARMENRAVTGAEAELAAEVGSSGIPLELFEPTAEKRAALEKRAISGAPATVGVNLDAIRPFVFAPSILPRLGVEMPRVPSGTYATGTVTTTLDGRSHEAGGASAGTAAAITVSTATPKRISARLELRAEDIAAIGQDNFESILRQNLSLALSDELDDQGLNGAGATTGTKADLNGLFTAVSDPGGTVSTIAKFDEFVSKFGSQVDGLWATTAADIMMVVGVDTFRLAHKTFRDTPNDGGDGAVAFTDYAAAHYGGFWTNKRMPATASNIQQALIYRTGRSAMGASAGMRTAVCPVWSEIMIDDVYTGSAKAERYLTFHVLLGDVILVQPDAYGQVQFKVS